MRRLQPLALPFLALLLTAACGDDPTTGGETTGAQPPKTEGTITIYSGREKDLVGPLFEKFTAATGIKVEARYGDTAELAAQILEEGDRSPADVFFAQDAGGLGAVSAKKLFLPLEQALTDRVPAAFRAGDSTWVGASGRARVVVYNTERVRKEDLPKTIDEFTAPRWKGKVGWAPTNASFQAFVTGYRLLKGDAAARTWLRKMKANDVQEYPKNTPIVEAVGSGEIDAGFVNHYYLLNIRKENAGIKAENHFLSAGDPGALVNVAGVGILKSSKNVELAGRFIEYVLGDEAQRYFAAETFEYSLVESVPADERLPDLKEIEAPDVDLARLSDLEKTLDMLKEEGLL